MDNSLNLGVLLITFDMKKAFDSLSHACLMKSLSEGGLPSGFLSWIKSFPRSQKQRVSLNGVLSPSVVSVTSGVPQGSVLAPYLFACHMGSLTPSLIRTCMIKYADDVTLLCPFDSINSVQPIIQNELDNMKNWCNEHGLSLNDNKTKILCFRKSRINYSPLDSIVPSFCTQLNILGVMFNSNLNWDSHVNMITKTASRRIHVLRQLKRIKSTSKSDLIKVYEGYILSVLEYNAPLLIGISKKNSDKLDMIRKRCHRIICGSDCDCKDFQTISSRRLHQSMTTFSRIQSPTHLLNSLIPHVLPRSRQYFLEPINTSRRLHSFVPFCCHEWNSHLSRSFLPKDKF